MLTISPTTIILTIPPTPIFPMISLPSARCPIPMLSGDHRRTGLPCRRQYAIILVTRIGQLLPGGPCLARNKSYPLRVPVSAPAGESRHACLQPPGKGLRRSVPCLSQGLLGHGDDPLPGRGRRARKAPTFPPD